LTQNVLSSERPIIVNVALPAPILNFGVKEATQTTRLAASTPEGRAVIVNVVRAADERGDLRY
jgi:hypothetical protein